MLRFSTKMALYLPTTFLNIVPILNHSEELILAFERVQKYCISDIYMVEKKIYIYIYVYIFIYSVCEYAAEVYTVEGYVKQLKYF